MDEAYVAAVEETLSDLTGERALGAKIASDVADCQKLDLLQELEESAAASGVQVQVARVLDILDRNIVWKDVRIACQAFRRLCTIMLEESPHSLQRHLVEAGPPYSIRLQTMLHNMMQHTRHGPTQRYAAELLCAMLAANGEFDLFIEGHALQIADCLVGVLRNHPEDLILQASALKALEAASSSATIKDEILWRIASPTAGGIPVLFDALSKFSISVSDDFLDHQVEHVFSVDISAIKNILKVLRSVLKSQPINRFLFDCFRNHPDWVASYHPIMDMNRLGHPQNAETFSILYELIHDLMIFQFEVTVWLVT